MASKQEVKEIVERLKKEIDSHPGEWNEEFRAELQSHVWSKWLSTSTDDELRIAVAAAFGESLDWYFDEADKHRASLIESQEKVCDEIDGAKSRLETYKEQVKLAQAEIEEGQSSLRRLARDLARPWVYPLPPTPDRQMALPLGDGEEWRAVPLSVVLEHDIALQSVVREKLGAINLGQYADEHEKFGLLDKPKKLTRRQWDRVEEAVQDWHASQGGDESTEAA